MIFYLANCRLYPTQATAKAVDRDFTQLDIPTDKPGLMAFINGLYEQIPELNGCPNDDEGQHTPDEHGQCDDCREVLPPARDPITVERRSFEDAWDDFPLPLKFHYAALAMEEGRERLK